MSATLAALPPAPPILFIEFRFIWIFAIIFLVHWALRGNTARKIWLLACSHAFYTCFFIGNPIDFFQNITAGKWNLIHEGWWFPLLLWFSTIMDYCVGLGIEAAKTERGRKLWVLGSLGVNLGVLGFFKYYGFFDENVRAVFSWLGLSPTWEPLKVFLPYGISFYTFQSLSYSIEVYRRHLPAERSFLNLAVFIAFFPQVVAGPIVRAMTFLPQTIKKTTWANVDVRGCLTLFFIGFVKKACVSDNLAGVVDTYFAAPQDYNSFSAWMAMFCYAGQIYCDFSGYTDMAIAVSRLLGYELCQNFAFPYFSATITDFWRRWHMSLSSWLRDYLYISLGGNRGSKLFTYRNLMLTMLLGGLWHGASWAFMLWGGLHGLALIFHREWARLAGARALAVMKWLGVPITFLWVLFAWVPFRAGDTYVGIVIRENGQPALAELPADGSAPVRGGKKVEPGALRMTGGGFVANGKEDDESVPLSGLRRNVLTGNWHKAPEDGSSAPDKIAARPLVARKVSGSWGTTTRVLTAMVTGRDYAKRSVVGNGMSLILIALALVHWLNSRQILSTWWRHIPDWCYAMLLGVGMAVAIFMKPVIFKAFIYFQF
jgi:alginate O-acetyltransferase complex protein AlgI